MKILQIAPYVTIDAKPSLTRNKTGFGYMVYDIAAGLAKNNEVDMLLLHCQYDEFCSDNIRFLENNKYKTLRGIFRPVLLLKLFSLICKYPMSFGGLVREMYQWLLMGYLEGIVKNGGYDVVHIHGCNYIDLAIIDLCKKYGVKFVVTLHGLNSFDESVKMDASGKRFEKDFLRKAYEHDWTLTFISSGMKRRVMEYLNVDKADNIHVVCNSFRFEEVKPETVNIRELYDIPSDSKIILYVGNQSENKNQKQMVRAFCRLHERLQRHTYILFVGRINEDYNLNEEIQKVAFGSHLIMCGVIPKAQMHAYYEQVDGTALFSISEGFGLSLIEGMSYGLPCVAIKTMDAFDDIYSPDSMVGVERHDDQLVADGLELLLTAEWDKLKIKEYAETFTLSKTSEKYCNVLRISNLRGVRRRCRIPMNSKVLCCVGSVGERKNQKQVIRAFAYLPEEIQNNTYILFVGREEESYEFAYSVSESPWSSHFIRCGMIDKTEVSDIYIACDGTIMVSLSEGFGLSLIEGMFYGKPSLAIKNMDAFEDIYSPDAMIGVERHDDKLIADGMSELLTRQWDANIIEKHASKFSNNKMTHNYECVFKL